MLKTLPKLYRTLNEEDTFQQNMINTFERSINLYRMQCLTCPELMVIQVET